MEKGPAIKCMQWYNSLLKRECDSILQPHHKAIMQTKTFRHDKIAIIHKFMLEDPVVFN